MVSKETIDKAAFIFIRHPDLFFTRKDLQNMLAISKASACRVLNELSGIIPLEEKKEGNNVFYRLKAEDTESIYDSIRLILSLSDNERLALSLLLGSTLKNSLLRTPIETLKRKFESAGMLSSDNNIIYSKKELTQNIDDASLPYLDTIFTSLETKTVLEVEYKGAFSDHEKSHQLWPVCLYMRNGNLYVYAYEEKHKGATSYAFSRIINATLKYDEHYILPNDIKAEDALNDPFGVSTAEKKKATVQIFNKQAFFEKEKKWPDGTKITECDDGSIIISLSISDPFAFKSWALSLGKDCLVLEPEEIAGWVKAEHEEALKLYK